LSFSALIEKFKKDAMTALRQKSLSLYQNQTARSPEKPVAPDLWIIDKNNHYRFIESKLPRDKINERQITGLVLIKKNLEEIASASVSIVNVKKH